jgi:hypothetical protein
VDIQLWRSYFERNRTERLPVPWGKGIQVEPGLREPLIRSLQRFQVGESGDGLHLKRGAARTGNADYAATIALFVGEEQEHARWLSLLITGMGGTLLTHHWSDRFFVALRRLCGLKMELMVLLVAEMIAIRYYRALHEGTEDPVLCAIFGQIRRDEDGHVAFHIAFLREAFSGWSWLTRGLVRTAWQALYRGACLLVMWDHRGVLKATGVRPSIFWRDTGRIFRDVAFAIFATPQEAPYAASYTSVPSK